LRTLVSLLRSEQDVSLVFYGLSATFRKPVVLFLFRAYGPEYQGVDEILYAACAYASALLVLPKEAACLEPLFFAENCVVCYAHAALKREDKSHLNHRMALFIS